MDHRRLFHLLLSLIEPLTTFGIPELHFFNRNRRPVSLAWLLRT